jgi:pimeloyl-ACP methyl ester carboxylesterase
MLLRSGAEARATGSPVRGSVICVNGGQSSLAEGTWSASLEWLAGRLAPRFPELELVEVRYRVKSWKRMLWCIEDARAAIETAGSERVLVLGFSMGGAVAIQAATHPKVEGVLGLAPWIPDRLDVAPLAGKRLDVIHGTLDRWLPGIPGVSPESSRRGYERARALGVPGSYTLLPRALHGIAVRAPWGLRPLPGAGSWLRQVAQVLEQFQTAAG